MFTIVLLLYVQLHLEVTLEGSSLRGVYRNLAECEHAAVKLRGPLPTPRGHAAAWHDAVCLPIGQGVRVNEVAPLDLVRLFQQWAPAGCGADGAWRRVAQLCMPSGGMAAQREESKPWRNRAGPARAGIGAASSSPRSDRGRSPPSGRPRGRGRRRCR